MGDECSAWLRLEQRGVTGASVGGGSCWWLTGGNRQLQLCPGIRCRDEEDGERAWE